MFNTTDNVLSHLQILMITKEQTEHKIYGHSESILTELPRTKIYYVIYNIIIVYQ